MPRHRADPVTDAELRRQVRATIWVCNIYVGLFAAAVVVLAAKRSALGLERAWARARARRAHRSRSRGGGVSLSSSLLRSAAASADSGSDTGSRRSSYGSCEGDVEGNCKTEKSFEQLPLARWCGKVDRAAGRPVDWPLVPSTWDWAKLVLVSAVVAANIAACLVVNMSIPKAARLSTLQFFAVRTGRVAVANFPIVFLFAGRNNPVTWVTGVPYQTIRTYHKLTGLCCFIETLLHTFAYLAFFVQRYGNQWLFPFSKTYIIWGTIGTLASIPCTLLALHSIRNRAYEWFLATHIIGAIVFLVGTWYHYRREVWIWILVSVGFWAAERAARVVAVASARWRRHGVVLQGEAEVCHGAVLLRVPLPEGSWKGGQHFYVYFWGWALLRRPWLYGQAHPMTVANSSGPGVTHVKFIIRVHGGITKTIAELVLMRSGLAGGVRLPVSLEGPFGEYVELQEYERVLLVGGGSGITFPASALSAIVNGGAEGSRPQEVKLVWAIHHLAQADWLRNALPAAHAFANSSGLRLSIDLYVTRDHSFSPTTSQADLARFPLPLAAPHAPEPAGPDSPGCDASAPLLEHADGRKGERAERARAKVGGSGGLAGARVRFGRPDVAGIVEEFARSGGGRMGVVACGPEGMAEEVKRAVGGMRGEGWDVACKVETFAG